jgi:hypothetical protein
MGRGSPTAHSAAQWSRAGSVAKVGRLRRAARWLRAPASAWVGTQSIRHGAAFAGEMARQLRTRPRRDPRLHLAEDGSFDAEAISFACGISSAELELRLAARQRQTGLAACLFLGMGVVLLLLWLIQVPFQSHRLMLSLEFLPVDALCLLLGFHQALLNYQIVRRRSASWREYITSASWPSL